ncbi:RmlC-like jelly roll [Corchorus olitorius]|uniref:RmlC-like jelly roll n=1 Tax=Corchorus olitorius TaxID=93759 RepID=A0A1R3KWQ7_9ROSI|nr:RmlC-like jelly roll [Corchorus olitorius]
MSAIEGNLRALQTDGGRSGVYNSITLKPGDFYGEELLTWALRLTSSPNVPTSTRTFRAIDAEDL